MQIKTVMTCESVVVGPATTLQKAAEKMADYDVGMLPVCDGGRLVGVLTDRDIAVRAVAQACDPKTTTVRDVMTREVVYCFEDQEVEEAARLMEEKQVRRLPILDRKQQLMGIVSLNDLLVCQLKTG